MDQKLCKKCFLEKDIIFFNKDKSKKDGYRNSCKECQKNYSSDFYSKNKERICKYSNNYYKIISDSLDYKLKRKEYMNLYLNKNKEKINKYNIGYYIKNKERISKYKVIYYMNNKEKIAKYKSDNRERINENSLKYYHLRVNNDDLYKLSVLIRNLIRISIKKNGYSKKSKTDEILGCSFSDFKFYLESKFDNWMTWSNQGLYNGELNYGWDIDHIVPLSSAKNEEEIMRLNHYTNLQPLCSFVNRVIKRDNMSWINVY